VLHNVLFKLSAEIQTQFVVTVHQTQFKHSLMSIMLTWHL